MIRKTTALILILTMILSTTVFVLAEDDITVTVSIYDNKAGEYKLSDYPLILPVDSYADIIMPRLKDEGKLTDYTFSGGSLTSVTFDSGKLTASGVIKWTYKVNNSVSDTDINAYRLNDGDKVLFEYAADYIPVVSATSKSSGTSKVSLQSGISSASSSSAGSSTSDIVSESGRETSAFSRFSVSSAAADIHSVPEYVKFNWTAQNNETLDMAIKYLTLNEPGDNYLIATGIAGRGSTPQIVERYVEDIKKTAGIYENSTYLQRDIMGLTFCGLNPGNIDGINLIEILADYKLYGLEGIAYALIALDCNDYEIGALSLNSREALIQKLLEYQNDDGGFPLDSNSASDIDMTAVSLTALSGYTEREDVFKSTSAAVDYLKTQFNLAPEDLRSESISRALVAITSMKIQITDSRFMKGEKNLVDFLSEFQGDDGGFRSRMKGETGVIPTEQAVIALSSVYGGKNPYKLKTELSIEETEPEPASDLKLWIISVITAIIIITAVIGVLIYMRRRRNSGEGSI